MKRWIVVLISLPLIWGIFIPRTAKGKTRWVSLNPTKPEGTPPEVEVLRSNESQMALRISIPKGLGYTPNIGNPQLPKMMIKIRRGGRVLSPAP